VEFTLSEANVLRMTTKGFYVSFWRKRNDWRISFLQQLCPFHFYSPPFP